MGLLLEVLPLALWNSFAHHVRNYKLRFLTFNVTTSKDNNCCVVSL